jgi:membrane protein YdbS with pleckstrin-like domain
MTTLRLIEKTEQEQRVAWEAYPSWAQFSWLFLLSALSALRGALFFRFGVEGREMWVVGAGLLIVCAAILRRWAHYELTRDRIIVRNGYTGHEIQSMSLNEVGDVRVQQGPVASFFEIATLVISSRATDRLLSLRGVSHPEELKIRIQASAWRNHRAATNSHPA